MNLLYLIPALPFAGFIVLALLGRGLSRATATLVGVGSVGMSALLALALAVQFIDSPPVSGAFTQTLWTWLQFDGYSAGISFSLDALSLVMVLIITVVGFLIHLYSSEFMQDDPGYTRFFAYLNLFVGSMLVLVLADNLLLLYFGWEGVGLCSYLLIGFWYDDPVNGAAARKAFIVTRIGDTAMALGLFLLFTELDTLNIQDLMQNAQTHWPVGSTTAVLAAALLLCGAIGKSAQLPLQVWLPDAMAGPTPVSALIHAATMVTAGVYLIARTHVLFELAPAVQSAVAVIGASTLLIAGMSALAQKDIKRVLAYSTISQLGYMFLALGVGAWSAAIFHLMIHAFFKALLFLGAGVVILAQHHEHDMFKMGGLKDKLPSTFWVFLIGSASLSALPLVTAGFYSKDLILWQTLASPSNGAALWLAGLLGAFVTSVYTFRMVFVTFFGQQQLEISYAPGSRISLPLIVLAVLSIFGGFIAFPDTLFPAKLQEHTGPFTEHMHQLVASVVSLSGIALAYLLYRRQPRVLDQLTRIASFESTRTFFLKGWEFDALYDGLFIRPFLWLVEICKKDIIDSGYTGIASLNQWLSSVLSRTQTGNIRWYAMGIAIGAVVFLGIAIFLH